MGLDLDRKKRFKIDTKPFNNLNSTKTNLDTKKGLNQTQNHLVIHNLRI